MSFSVDIRSSTFFSKMGFDTAENEASKVWHTVMIPYYCNVWIPYLQPRIKADVLIGIIFFFSLDFICVPVSLGACGLAVHRTDGIGNKMISYEEFNKLIERCAEHGWFHSSRKKIATIFRSLR